jgi:hypothetical protein
MLQEFLDSALLQIEDESEKFAWLRTAAEKIAEELVADRWRIVPFIMIALDSEAPSDDPVFGQIEAAVKTQWTTIRARYKDTPVQNYRGVLWEAIELAGQKDPSLAAIIWLTGSSYLPLSSLEQRARFHCEELFS